MVKVPVTIVCSLLAFVLGAGAAVVGMTLFGSKLDGVRLTFAVDRGAKPSGGEGGKGGPGKGKGMGMGMGKGMPPMGKGMMPPGMMPGGMPGMGKGTSPTKQLDDLVAKLDVLTSPPTLDLTKEERKQLTENVSSALKEDEITDESARKHLDAILKIVEGHKDALAKVGFRWPGGGGGGFGGFAAPPDSKAVKERMVALQKRLNDKAQ